MGTKISSGGKQGMVGGWLGHEKKGKVGSMRQRRGWETCHGEGGMEQEVEVG